MSTPIAFALIIATNFAAFFCYYWLSTLASRVGVEIETGVIHGVPISTRYRDLLLYSKWAGYSGTAVAIAIFGVVAALGVASYLTEGRARDLAYVTAVLGVIGALARALWSPVEMTHYRSTLRQAKRD
jgi:hypothetical protein